MTIFIRGQVRPKRTCCIYSAVKINIVVLFVVVFKAILKLIWLMLFLGLFHVEFHICVCIIYMYIAYTGYLLEYSYVV